MRRTALLLALLLAGILPTAPARGGEDPDKWDHSFDRILRDHVRGMQRLAKWCEDQGLAASAWTMRQQAFRLAPDDEELAEDLGYRKLDDGSWSKDPNSREKLRKTWDTTPNDKTDDRDRKYARACSSIARRLASLARKAAKAAEKDPSDAWRSRESRAWAAALRVDPGYEKAHVALGHEQVGGRYVSPRWLPFLRARQEFDEAAKNRARRGFEVTALGSHPALVAARIQAAGARCGQFSVQSQFGEAVAREMAVWNRRAAVELQLLYGFPDPICMGAEYLVADLKDVETWKRALVAFGKTRDEAESDAKSMVGVWARNHAFIRYRQDGETAHEPAHDASIQSVVRWAVWQYCGEPGPGDWFSEAMALDVVYRLTGQAISTFVSDEGYRDTMRDSPEMNRWQAVSRLVLDRDDDVPIQELARVSLNRMDTRHTSKAYCFLQFLRERDPRQVKSFITEALQTTTLDAIRKVYTMSPETLDAEYAAWLRGTFPPAGL